MFTWIFGDCREGYIPRSLLRFQTMMPRSLLRGISLKPARMSLCNYLEDTLVLDFKRSGTKLEIYKEM